MDTLKIGKFIARMRKEKIMSHCIELIQTKKFAYPDQDILNILFKGNVFILPQEWNYISYCNNNFRFDDKIVEQHNQAIAKLKILHFAGNKPWVHDNVQFEELFWLYARKSLYYEKLLIHKNNKSRIRNFVFRCVKNNVFFKLIRMRYPNFYMKFKKIYNKFK